MLCLMTIPPELNSGKIEVAKRGVSLKTSPLIHYAGESGIMPA